MGSDISKQKEYDLDIDIIKKKLIVVEAQKKYLFDKCSANPYDDAVSFQLGIVLNTEIELKQSLNDLDLLKFCDKTGASNLSTERTELLYKYINKHMKSFKEPDDLSERFNKLSDSSNYDLLIPKAPTISPKIHPHHD
jgi:hypothetical protein